MWNDSMIYAFAERCELCEEGPITAFDRLPDIALNLWILIISTNQEQLAFVWNHCMTMARIEGRKLCNECPIAAIRRCPYIIKDFNSIKSTHKEDFAFVSYKRMSVTLSERRGISNEHPLKSVFRCPNVAFILCVLIMSSNQEDLSVFWNYCMTMAQTERCCVCNESPAAAIRWYPYIAINIRSINPAN